MSACTHLHPFFATPIALSASLPMKHHHEPRIVMTSFLRHPCRTFCLFALAIFHHRNLAAASAPRSFSMKMSLPSKPRHHFGEVGCQGGSAPLWSRKLVFRDPYRTFCVSAVSIFFKNCENRNFLSVSAHIFTSMFRHPYRTFCISANEASS